MKRHFTATAFIVDAQNRTLLLWHKHLQRWMPAGGHVDENEAPEDAAKRECMEETGLDVEILGRDDLPKLSTLPFPDLFEGNQVEGRMLKTPIAMLLEEIPARPERGEEAHQHMDFLFLAKPIDESQKPQHKEAEAHAEMRWFTKEEVAALNEATEIFGNVKRYILTIL
ncbi:MAG: NUDIX domain-containing protein [Candidatus Peribacteraceae bacterium]